MPTLTLPTTADVPRVLPSAPGVPYLLMRHFSNLPRGRSIVKISGVYTLFDNPTQDQLTAAGATGEGTDFFLGGHGPYIIASAVATALTTDGLGAYVS